MPFKIFDFYCKDCNDEREYFVKVVDGKEVSELKCENCGSENLDKVLSVQGYQIYGNNSASIRPKNAGSFKRKKTK